MRHRRLVAKSRWAQSRGVHVPLAGPNTPREKLECILLSEDSNSYCMGLVKRHGSTAAAEPNFNAFVTKFGEDTVWSMSRITLAKENTPFISSPVKHVVDLTKTKVAAVLQSTPFPKIPTPPENLATVLRLPRQQKMTSLQSCDPSKTNGP